MRLANKVAIVTGASSGIGNRIARLFSAEGAIIVAADINVASGMDLVADIKKNGGQAEFVKTDVAVVSEAENLAQITCKAFGKIDVLVNSAGIFMRDCPFEDTDEELWDHIHDVNVKGTFLVSKYVVRQMKKTGGGVIINMASIASFKPTPHRAPYASSKGAVLSLTKTMAFELAPNKIRVSCICPTVVETPMAELFSEEEKGMILNAIPLGRFGKVEDVAYSALFLASDESSMVTGSSIVLDGGQAI
jgi:3-oxoacyl-[acyl-carrier protein] reductase